MKKKFSKKDIGNSTSINPFVVLGPLEDQIHPPEEGEILPSKVLYSEMEESVGNIEIPASQPSGVPILQEIHNSPSRLPSSPCYAEILKKKVVYSSGSSDDDSFEQS